MKYLDRSEEAKLEKFVADKKMFNAVKKVLLKHIYTEGILKVGEPVEDSIKNFILQKSAMALQNMPEITNEMLGEQLRADTQALRIVELGFLEGFNEFKPKEITLPKENNAI